MPDDEAAKHEQLDRVTDDEVHSVEGVGEIEMPAPNPSAIAAASAAAPSEAKPAADEKPVGPVDRHGRSFDPAIHECDDAKAPILGKNNKLKIRRGGDMRSYVASPRGAAAGEGATAASSSTSSAPIGEAAPAAPDFRKVAETWTNPALDTVTAVLGPEWVFDAARRARYVDCAERIAAKRNIQVEMAPELELAFLFWGDFVARIELPDTKRRYEKAKSAVSTWWSRLWQRATGRRPRAAEPSSEAEATEPSSSSEAAPVSEGGRELKDAERVEPIPFPRRDASPHEAPLSTEPLPLPTP